MLTSLSAKAREKTLKGNLRKFPYHLSYHLRKGDPVSESCEHRKVGRIESRIGDGCQNVERKIKTYIITEKGKAFSMRYGKMFHVPRTVKEKR